MQHVHTVSFPDPQLLADLSPLPGGLHGVVWDMKEAPGGDLGSIDGVILPYINAGAVLGSLGKVPDLKFVQTQVLTFRSTAPVSLSIHPTNVLGQYSQGALQAEQEDLLVDGCVGAVTKRSSLCSQRNQRRGPYS